MMENLIFIRFVYLFHCSYEPFLFCFVQGDIIMSPKTMKRAKAAALGESAENWIADETHRWPNNEIPYKYGTFFSK